MSHNRRFLHRSNRLVLAGALALACGFCTSAALAVPTIVTAGSTPNSTNYSDSGLNIGNSGYWFANFGAATAVSGAPVDQNDANALPSWVQVDFDPASVAYSFSLNSPSSASSTGGVTTYNNLILPDGSSGLSGQLVDNTNASGTQSNNIITAWRFGANAPPAAFIHVVLDNAPTSAETIVQRLRVTHRNAAQTLNPTATFDNLAAGANGTADVYTFRLDGIEPGGSFAVQLRTNGNTAGTADTALAGIAFDAIPEPSSLGLLALGGAAAGLIVIRRRRQAGQY
ncbi:MAG: PEP-CTERM sorting domain-containing protein [Pirellulales bacterium]|nr:PEP-CTERM sorting domain-containing protein [Pirellulales bacterium]